VKKNLSFLSEKNERLEIEIEKKGQKQLELMLKGAESQSDGGGRIQRLLQGFIL
jgi:hypothetical protein